jgi:hypothetical protein
MIHSPVAGGSPSVIDASASDSWAVELDERTNNAR